MQNVVVAKFSQRERFWPNTSWAFLYFFLFLIFLFLLKDSEVLSAPETSCYIDCKEHSNFTKNRIPVLSVLFLLGTEFPQTGFFLSCCFSLLPKVFEEHFQKCRHLSLPLMGLGPGWWKGEEGSPRAADEGLMEMLEVLPEITVIKECGAQEKLALLEPTLMASPLTFSDLLLLKRVCFVWWF